jgi:hypothetical protein
LKKFPPRASRNRPPSNPSISRFRRDYGDHRFHFPPPTRNPASFPHTQHLRSFLPRVTSPSHFRRRSNAIPSNQLPLISTPPVPTSVRDGSSDIRASSLPIFRITKESERRIYCRPW